MKHKNAVLPGKFHSNFFPSSLQFFKWCYVIGIPHWAINNLFSWGKSDTREKRAVRAVRKDASCVYSKMMLQGVKQTQKFRSCHHLVCISRNQKLTAVWLDHYTVSLRVCVLTSPDTTWEITRPKDAHVSSNTHAQTSIRCILHLLSLLIPFSASHFSSAISYGQSGHPI